MHRPRQQVAPDDYRTLPASVRAHRTDCSASGSRCSSLRGPKQARCALLRRWPRSPSGGCARSRQCPGKILLRASWPPSSSSSWPRGRRSLRAFGWRTLERLTSWINMSCQLLRGWRVTGAHAQPSAEWDSSNERSHAREGRRRLASALPQQLPGRCPSVSVLVEPVLDAKSQPLQVQTSPALSERSAVRAVPCRLQCSALRPPCLWCRW